MKNSNNGNSTQEVSAGYHLDVIPKSRFGTTGKIMEECLELMDAEKQGCRIMQLVEMSDLVGAIEGVLEENFPGFTVEDLLKMSDITKRAFRNGRRA